MAPDNTRPSPALLHHPEPVIRIATSLNFYLSDKASYWTPSANQHLFKRAHDKLGIGRAVLVENPARLYGFAD
jgi:hypothetical protein